MSIVLDTLDYVFTEKGLGEFEYITCQMYNDDYATYLFTISGDEQFFAHVGVVDDVSEYKIGNEEQCTIVDSRMAIMVAIHQELLKRYNKYLEEVKEKKELREMFNKQQDYIKGEER